MRILIIKDKDDTHGMSIFLKKIESVLTGPQTEYDSEGFDHIDSIGILRIKKTRYIAIPIPKEA